MRNKNKVSFADCDEQMIDLWISFTVWDVEKLVFGRRNENLWMNSDMHAEKMSRWKFETFGVFKVGFDRVKQLLVGFLCMKGKDRNLSFSKFQNFKSLKV